jgi:hypothetical protein
MAPVKKTPQNSLQPPAPSEPQYPRRGLCYRCEERARFLELGRAARCECGDVQRAVHGCYMYRPVLPHKLKPIDGDRRPILAGALIAGRACSAGRPGTEELELRVCPGPAKGEVLMYYAPPRAYLKAARARARQAEERRARRRAARRARR